MQKGKKTVHGKRDWTNVLEESGQREADGIRRYSASGEVVGTGLLSGLCGNPFESLGQSKKEDGNAVTSKRACTR